LSWWLAVLVMSLLLSARRNGCLSSLYAGAPYTGLTEAVIPLSGALRHPWVVHRFRPRLPRRTIRVRLALLCFGVFLASGVALLAVTVAVWQSRTAGTTQIARGPAGSLRHPAVGITQHSSDRRQLLIASGIALTIMAGLSLALGWLVAGRFLAPLRTITTTTREISATSLHERLNLAGPDDELKELGDTFDELLARLERAFQFERRFVANASHELRTPLATMRASLDVAMAKPGPVPPQIVTLADRLRHQLDHVERLLDSFLTLAQAQQGPVAEQSTLSLSEIASAAIERRAGTISLMKLSVGQEGCPDAWVAGSETLLSRMVENVIDNAISHNQPGGWVRVQTTLDGPIARLVVENGGPVLAQADVQQLAQPFRRLGAERTGSDTGTGLGLSIVSSIAEVHGGTLDLHARGGGGLRVEITLPLAVATGAGART
jgi:signal transduction histidine kinase